MASVQLRASTFVSLCIHPVGFKTLVEDLKWLKCAVYRHPFTWCQTACSASCRRLCSISRYL